MKMGTERVHDVDVKLNSTGANKAVLPTELLRQKYVSTTNGETAHTGDWVKLLLMAKSAKKPIHPDASSLPVLGPAILRVATKVPTVNIGIQDFVMSLCEVKHAREKNAYFST